MYRVDKEGVLYKDNQVIVSSFFTKWDLFNYSMLYEVVKNFSVVHKIVNYILESNYTVHLDQISRTEKNKGRDYMSSGYTVTAGISHKDINPSETKNVMKGFNDYLYTFRGVSSNFFKTVVTSYPNIINTYLNYDQPPEFHKYIGQDIYLTQYMPDKNENPYWIVFNPVKIIGLREESFNLDVMDQSMYLSYMTKFMEMFGNCYLTDELTQTVNMYELWLFSILNKYFKYYFVTDMLE